MAPPIAIPLNQAIVLCGVGPDETTVIPLAVNNAGELVIASGSSTIGKVDQGAGAALSSYWPVRVTDGTNGMPTMDVAARRGFVGITDGTNSMPTMDAVARAGFQKITDGTSTAAVKAASTAALATDPALVVAVSPNNAVTVVPSTRVSRTVHLASAALPAAGAWTNQSTYAIPDGAKTVTFWVTYTIGAAGGYPKHKIMLGNGTEEGPPIVINGTITVSQPNGTRVTYQDNLEGPHPADGTPIIYAIQWTDFGGATTIRLLAAEVGQVATPGTCAIALTVGY